MSQLLLETHKPGPSHAKSSLAQRFVRAGGLESISDSLL